MECAIAHLRVGQYFNKERQDFVAEKRVKQLRLEALTKFSPKRCKHISAASHVEQD